MHKYRILNEEVGEDPEIDDSTMSDKPFAGLDLRSAKCFGFSVPTKDNWLQIAKQSENIHWDLVDVKQLEKNLVKDVEDSYLYIASFELVDVDDDMKYALKFNNNEALWQLDIADSPKAELTIEQRGDFFKSDMFKKVAKKTYQRLLDAKEVYDRIVEYHMKHGEFLLVDLVKLEAILKFLDTEYFMQNVLNGKYLSY